MADEHVREAIDPSKEDKLRVFLSYSRQNEAVMRQIADDLLSRGFAPDFDQATYDPDQISGGISAEDEWWVRIQEMIAASDVMLFLVSPGSSASAVCDEEIAYARALGKRIIAASVEPIDFAKAPPRLAALNVQIDFSDTGPGYAAAISKTEQALNTNVNWHRQGRRLFDRISEWDRKQRPTSLLLRGAALIEAESWASRRPAGEDEPGDLFHDYLTQSRSGEQKRERQARWVRRTIVGLGGVGIVFLISSLFGFNRLIENRQDFSRDVSSLIAKQSQTQIESSEPESAMRIALASAAGTWLEPISPSASYQMGRSAGYLLSEARLPSPVELGSSNRVRGGVWASDNSAFAVGINQTPNWIWSRGNDGHWDVQELSEDLSEVMEWSRRGNRLATSTSSGMIKIWSRQGDGDWQIESEFSHAEEGRPYIMMSHDAYDLHWTPDDTALVVTRRNGEAATWTQTDDGFWSRSSDPEAILDLNVQQRETYERLKGLTTNSVKLQSAIVEQDIYAEGEFVSAFDGTYTEINTCSGIGGERACAPQILRRSGSLRWGYEFSVQSLTDDGTWVETPAFITPKPISKATWSPDGTILATNGAEHSVLLWSQLEDGNWTLARTIEMGGYIRNMSWSPTENRLALSVSDMGTYRVDLIDDLFDVPLKLMGSTAKLAWSDDGSRLATISDNAETRLWSSRALPGWPNQRLEGQFSGRRGPVGLAKLKFAPGRDDRFFAVSDFGSVKVWTRDEAGEWNAADLEGAKNTGRLAFSTNETVAWSADGEEIVVLNSTGGTDRISLFSYTADGLWTEQSIGRHRGGIFVDWSPDARMIAVLSLTARGYKITLHTAAEDGTWSEETVYEANRSELEEPKFATWTPDASGILVGGFNVNLMVIEPGPDGVWTATSLTDESGNLFKFGSAQYSSDGERIATIGIKRVSIFSQQHDADWTSEQVTGGAWDVSWSPAETLLAVLPNKESHVEIWMQKPDGVWESQALRLDAGRAVASDWSPDGRYLIVGYNTGEIRFWDTQLILGESDWKVLQDKRGEVRSKAQAICEDVLSNVRITSTDPESGAQVTIYPNRLLDEHDVAAAPLLQPRLGEDVCATHLNPPSLAEQVGTLIGLGD